jgi:hypothetical protein
MAMSNRIRQRNWRRRQAIKRKQAAIAAKTAHVAELAAKRAAKGLPPILTAKQRSLQFEQRETAARAAKRKIAADEAALKASHTERWYAEPMTRGDAADFVVAHKLTTGDPQIFVSQKDAQCRLADINLNAFVLRNNADEAQIKRIILHELVKAGRTIEAAAEETEQSRYIADGATPIEMQTSKAADIAESHARWHNGQEIRDALNS